MGKRPKRKIVLFLIEGKSDREALQITIPELYDQIDENIEVFFPIMRDVQKNAEDEAGGDITSKIIPNKGAVKPENIEINIYEYFLRNFFDEQKILPKDVSEIIQIVDIDGVYVPDDAVSEGKNPNGTDKTYYGTNSIICSNTRNIIKRNEYKRENLDYLSSLNTIKVRQKSPCYSVYYFSCNLDHFLHNSANLDHTLKTSLAEKFARNYIGNPEGFANAISNDPDAATGMDYAESWNFIKEGLNSLQRHTNLNILLDKLVSEGTD